MKIFSRRALAGCAIAILAAAAAVPPDALAQGGTTITGRILDVDGGLPVAGATVELEHGSSVVATTTTAQDGSFSFPNEAQGVYNVQISANGYQTTLSQDIFVLANESQVSVQTAIEREQSSLHTIAAVRVSGNAALQTSATINEHIDPIKMTDQNFMRSGDILATLPFVNGGTSTSIGDDLSISIRGYDSSETATLLDGHPIGPIGAFGQGYDYQNSPFWGLSAMNVVYGSGATGLYGAATMAGAVDFQTISPTRDRHFTFTQGFGNDGKTMTGLQTTGTLQKLGYAFAYGVEGTQGNLTGNPTQWNLLLDPSQCNANSPDAGLPSIRRADVLACSYPVSGDYLLRNGVAKLTYDFTPRTSVEAAAFNSEMNADSTGNGDTDYQTYAQNSYNNPTAPSTNSQTLPNGTTATCNNSWVVLNDSASGYECMSNDQYNQTFSGPSGGGLGRYHDAHLQDYHARVKQRIGPTQLIVDGYVDNYGYDNVKGPFPHHHYTDIYRTHGFLVSDEFATGKNYVTAGTFLEHQQHIGFDIGAGSVKPDLQTTANNYFVRDTYSPNLKFTTFLDLSEQSIHSQGAFFDPRLSFVYHATANDVVRLTAGRSTSIPDPSNIYGGFSFVDPGSWNLDTCPASGLIQVGSGSSSTLKPESANDYEMAYGHRFNRDTVVQLNLYSSHETNPLINALFPLSSTVPGSELPSNFYASSDPADPGATIQGKLNAKCGAGYGTTHLGVQTLFNAGSAKYQGGDVGATVGVLPNVKVNGDYAVQSASYNGVPDYILQSNTGMINGQQLWYIPLHRASLGIGYSDSTGFATRIDGYYVGMPNEFQRPAFMYANFNISKSFPTGVTVNLGVNNLFNSAAQQYGFFGYGQFRPQNQYGSAANAFDEASEEFGLPYRQLWFTVTQKI